VILSVKFSPTSSGLQAGSIALKNQALVSVNYAVAERRESGEISGDTRKLSFGAVRRTGIHKPYS